MVALFSLPTLQLTARADEGMWPFNNVPRAEIKRQYGFEITDAWLKKVRLQLAARSVERFVVWASHEVEDYARVFGLAPQSLQPGAQASSLRRLF